MRTPIAIIVCYCFVFNSVIAQKTDVTLSTEQTRTALYVELGGKGYISINADFRISDRHRISIGVTSLDYDIVDDTSPDEINSNNWPSPGIMYYYLTGTRRSKFELGAGFSTSPFLGKTYDSDLHSDHPLSIHGVIGYRYQKQNGMIFRAGFTPFYRPKVWFLPLVGISLGYSW